MLSARKHRWQKALHVAVAGRNDAHNNNRLDQLQLSRPHKVHGENSQRNDAEVQQN